MALAAGRKGVLPSELTPDGKIKGTNYTLPAASANTLGGVKVGSGLSVTEEGVLSVSGGFEIKTFEYNVGYTQFSAKEIQGNFTNISLSDIPANAVVISAMMLPSVSTGDPQFIYPLLGRSSNGSIHVGLANMFSSGASFTGKLIIKYYLEG